MTQRGRWPDGVGHFAESSDDARDAPLAGIECRIPDIVGPTMRTFRSGPVFLAALLSGCASVTPFKGLPLTEPSSYVSSVPLVQQDEDHACGAACVAAVAAHWGVDLSTFRSAHPHLPTDATGRDLQELAEQLGLRAFAYQGSIDDLRDNVSKGRPLIVMIPKPLIGIGGNLVTTPLINVWNRYGPRPRHWVVVVGLLGDHHVIINDPASGSLTVKANAFKSWWAKNDNLCVLIASADAGGK